MCSRWSKKKDRYFVNGPSSESSATPRVLLRSPPSPVSGDINVAPEPDDLTCPTGYNNSSSDETNYFQSLEAPPRPNDDNDGSSSTPSLPQQPTASGTSDHSDSAGNVSDEEDSPSSAIDDNDDFDYFSSLEASLENMIESSNSSDSAPTAPSEIDLSSSEEGMLELIRLLDSSGAPRGLYDDVITLLKRLTKNGFDVRNARSREVFLRTLSGKVPLPSPTMAKVKGHSVFKFSFLDMLQDLFDSPAFESVSNLCVNEEVEKRFDKFVPSPGTIDDMEAACRAWASETFDNLEGFIPGKDLFVPLIFYADKTGTDRFQRYPLEPWMFTTLLLRRDVRQDANMWRHLGFIPSVKADIDEFDRHVDDGEADNDEGGESNHHCTKDGHVNMQLYHDFLHSVMSGVRECQEQKSLMRVNLGGVQREVRVHVHIAFVMGDQLSQDLLCGRVANTNTDAGRIHRACMCSGARASDTLNESCSDFIDPELVEELNGIALHDPKVLKEEIHKLFSHGPRRVECKQASDYVKTKVKLARALAGKPYCLYPINNGFRGLSFGANDNGIFEATVEDSMHSLSAGVISNVNDTTYGSFTAGEKKKFDHILRSILLGCRSSVLFRYPSVAIKKNFSFQSLLTHNEKVGSLLLLLMSMHNVEGRELFAIARNKQLHKYYSFSKKKTSKKKSKRKRHQERNGDSDSDSDPSASDSGSESSDGEENATSKAASKRRVTAEDVKLITSAENRSKIIAEHPHRLDYTFSNGNEKNAFDRSEDSVKFIIQQLRLYGFSTLLEQSNLDEIQVEQLMKSAWPILKGNKSRPRSAIVTPQCIIDSLGDSSMTSFLQAPREDASVTECPLFLNCKEKLRTIHNRPNSVDSMSSLPYHHSFPIDGCVEKHRRKRQKVDKGGKSAAVLGPPEHFVYFIEYLLCYHAWCHYGYKLRDELRNDTDLIDYGSRLLVTYVDTFIYRGDDTTDTDTCKLHSQSHNTRTYKRFGDLMQYDCGQCERGLKFWGKFPALTARKHGQMTFLSDTTSRIWEQMLYRKAFDSVERKKSRKKSPSETTADTDTTVGGFELGRRHCHFKYSKSNGGSWEQKTYDRFGNVVNDVRHSAKVHDDVLKSMRVLDDEATEFHIWCDAKLPNGDIVKCWPQYRQDKGPFYDWVMAKFPYEDDGMVEYKTHPAKVLAIYKVPNGQMKALVHSVEEKTTNCDEGPYGDTQLVTHYSRHFFGLGRRRPKMKAPSVIALSVSALTRTILAYEAMPSLSSPLPPSRVTEDEAAKHTVAVMRPIEEWAELWLTWTESLQKRQTGDGENKYELKP